eukprot:CAMPEP_0203750872 /NCGR_PEP_ID=MMETSP0098-20131031/5032_1 /ASSEMBLY_ACC=CAM_ASM_000208 /TAXON_ID=96639 /ORGANISM=" , Strain NY0313808BC1" /LENGTH=1011 /DNA_ID=CAMNT_0050640349 /DNA_START=167 /DNA_END=3199 /DNA_ORIENTATION=-
MVDKENQGYNVSVEPDVAVQKGILEDKNVNQDAMVLGVSSKVGKAIPVARISHDKLVSECEQVAKVLLKANAHWTDRIGALERLRKVAANGGAADPEFLVYLTRLNEPLAVQLKDLRSAIVKEASLTIGEIATAFQAQSLMMGTTKSTHGYAPLAVNWIDTCLKQTCVTIKVISESASRCIRTIVMCAAPVGIGKLLSRLTRGCSAKASNLRLVCVEYIDVALREWTLFPRTQNRTDDIRDALKQTIQDSDDKVRRLARSCFWSFHAYAPEAAAQLMRRFDEATQRRLREVEHRTPVIKQVPKNRKPRKEACTSPQKQDEEHQSTDDDTETTRSVGTAASTEIDPHSPTMTMKSKRVPVRIQVKDEEPKRDYHPGDYSDGQSRRETHRRMAGPQRIVTQAPSAGGTVSGNAKMGAGTGTARQKSTLGGAVRVGNQQPEDRRVMGTAPNQRPAVAQPTYHSTATSERALLLMIQDLAQSSHWKTRADAMKQLLTVHKEEGDTHFTPGVIGKLIPVLCDRGRDAHYRVTQEVLNGIIRLLPLYQKEFAEHLKQLLISLLAGLSDPKTDIRKQSNIAINLCTKQFPHDQLCATLCGISRKKGDKLRLGCIDLLTTLVPSCRGYFANPLHMHQMILRVEPCLSSRKAEQRGSGANLLEQLFRYDKPVFCSQLQSSEVPEGLRSLVVKFLSNKIDGFETIAIQHAAAPPTQAKHSEGHHHHSKVVNAPVVPKVNPLCVNISPAKVNASSSETLPPKVNTSPPKAKALTIDTSPPVAKTAGLEELGEGKQNQREVHITTLLNDMSLGDDHDKQTALEQITRLLSQDNSSIDWENWIAQVLMGCVDRIKDPCILIREEAVQLIGKIAVAKPIIFGKSCFQVIFVRLLQCFCEEGGSQTLYAVDLALQKMVSHIEPPAICFSVLVDLISRETGAIQRECLKLVKLIFPRVGSGMLLESLPSLVPALHEAFDSSDPGIRRAVTMNFVELEMLLGDAIQPYKAGLTKPQRKLITIYVERRR